MALRQLPGLGLYGFWPTGADWGAEDSPDRRLLSVIVQGAVLSRVAAEPGAPTDGDIYLLTGTANAGKLAVRDDGAWVYITPKEGWRFWVSDEDKPYTYSGSAWVRETQPFFVNTFFVTPPASDEVLMDVIFGTEVSFAAAFGGSVGSVTTNPAAAFTLDIQKSSGGAFSSVGSITISTAGAFTFSGTSNFATGDRLRIVAPTTTDAAIRGFAASLRGSR